MKVPISWLREYVEVNVPVGELAERLTMAGVEVGEVREIGGWDEVYVGLVTGVRAHPNADRLRVCSVSTGGDDGEGAEVVCGAPNVAAGQKVCLARVGARLFNAQSGRAEVLGAARIRGVESQGMICSELELGLGEDHSGIVVLPEDAPLGAGLSDYLGDAVLDLELTPNRLDCLSMLGVAHEVAALTGGRVVEPEAVYAEGGAPAGERVRVSIADPDLCRRYTAAVIEGVSIGPSPRWLQERLVRAGLRPISNVVDVTNFVMLEYNQPLHAFDLDAVGDGVVVVRRAREGERLVTLDGVERVLTGDNLVIADGRGAMGLGGVIGGADSEIGAGTTRVLLEAATFDAVNNRETARAMGLRTEATLRFEKGLRAELAPRALRRATALIQQVAGGVAAPGMVDVYPDPPAGPLSVRLTMGRLRQSLGMEIGTGEARAALEALGFECGVVSGGDVGGGDGDGGDLEVVVPWWRNDVGMEDDLVEEVVRVIGYDAVPTVMLAAPIPFHSPLPGVALREEVKDLLAAGGMQEVINYPLVSAELLARIPAGGALAAGDGGAGDGVLGDGGAPLRVANPMSGAHEYLRTSLQGGLLATLAANQSRGLGALRLFEAGRVFQARPGDLPEEPEMVAGALWGRREAASWHFAGGDHQAAGQRAAGGRAGGDLGLMDFYDAKGVVEGLLERLGVRGVVWEAGEYPVYQPGRCAVLRHSGTVLGFVGEVHPPVRERFGLGSGSVAGFELRLGALLGALPESRRRFAALPRYPAAIRDVALTVPVEVTAGRVAELILRHRLVREAELFDVYSGEGLAPGTKSLAFQVHFQAEDRTLTNDEVSRSLDGLLRSLGREVGAVLRG